MALARLQFRGITEDQILNVCRLIELNGYNTNGAPPGIANRYSQFNNHFVIDLIITAWSKDIVSH